MLIGHRLVLPLRSATACGVGRVCGRLREQWFQPYPLLASEVHSFYDLYAPTDAAYIFIHTYL